MKFNKKIKNKDGSKKWKKIYQENYGYKRTQGNVNENSTKTNNIKSKAPETKLGKLYEELVAKHGRRSKELLDRDTMNDTIKTWLRKLTLMTQKMKRKN